MPKSERKWRYFYCKVRTKLQAKNQDRKLGVNALMGVILYEYKYETPHYVYSSVKEPVSGVRKRHPCKTVMT
jgi:hypothetical protein